MGLLNKLKNALFEEEEVEVDSTPDKVVIQEEPEKKKEKDKPEIPLENERELFKAENTFNFPDFDEEEFVSNYEPLKTVEPKLERPEEKPLKRRSDPIYTENKGKTSERFSIRKEKNVEPAKPEEKKFIPSPIISPVYGILDKNYKKEDIIEKKPEPPKKIDVDSVRKKAFGTLEDDIEKTMNESVEKFYNEESKSIDDLLNDSIDDTILINYDDDEEEKKDNDFTNRIEEELDNGDINLETKESKPEDISKEDLENNTLENDLFDLIDSMYDSKEDD